MVERGLKSPTVLRHMPRFFLDLMVMRVGEELPGWR
mgnify:CR=1 FL=1